MLWLAEEGVRYVVGPQGARAQQHTDDDDASDARRPSGGRDREKVGIWMPRGLRQRLRISYTAYKRFGAESKLSVK